MFTRQTYTPAAPARRLAPSPTRKPVNANRKGSKVRQRAAKTRAHVTHKVANHLTSLGISHTWAYTAALAACDNSLFYQDGKTAQDVLTSLRGTREGEQLLETYRSLSRREHLRVAT